MPSLSFFLLLRYLSSCSCHVAIFVPAICLCLLLLSILTASGFSSYPQVFLAVLFNSGLLLAAQAAGKAFFSLDVLLAYTVACLLTIAYDTVYAHMDKDDDQRMGVKSLALKWGAHTRPRLFALYGMAFGLFVWLVPHHPLNAVIFITAMNSALCFFLSMVCYVFFFLPDIFSAS